MIFLLKHSYDYWNGNFYPSQGRQPDHPWLGVHTHNEHDAFDDMPHSYLIMIKFYPLNKFKFVISFNSLIKFSVMDAITLYFFRNDNYIKQTKTNKKLA